MYQKLACLLALLPFCSYAVDLDLVDVADIQKNVIYTSTETINLRVEPPKTMFYILGDKIGSVEQGDEVILTNKEIVNTLLGKHYWGFAETFNPSTRAEGSGWMYIGKVGDESPLVMP